MTIHSTQEITQINGVPARIWEGESERGAPVIVFVTRIAVREDLGEAAHAEFLAELEEHTPPSPDAGGWPRKMFID